MKVEQLTLNNKLRTLFIDQPGSTMASLQIWFRAGSALENKQDYGIAHFLEHMFFKGTKKRPGAQIAREVESFGGELNAFTSFDYTCYFINSPNLALIKSIDILLDMVCHPAFLIRDIPPERGVVFEEYRRSIDSSNQYNFMQIQKNIFNSFYGHPILGTEKSIKNFDREQLINFRKKHYNRSNALFVVSGDLKNKKKIIEKINQYRLPQGPESKFPKFSLKKVQKIFSHHKEVRMCMFNMVIKAPGFLDKFTASEDLAISCLGYGETSFLYKKLVLDSTLANNVSASTMYFSDGGMHFISFSCPEENLIECIKKFFNTIQNVLENQLEAKEVYRIKEQYVASKLFEKESLESYAFSLGHGFAQNGNIFCEHDFISNIEEATIGEVNKALKRIFEKELNINLQLPQNVSSTTYEKLIATERDKLQKKLIAKKENQSLSIKFSKFDKAVKQVDFNNGVNFIYRQNEMTPTFTLSAFSKGALNLEEASLNGIHNIFSHLITKGYEGVDFDQLKEDLEMKSASLSGFAGRNATGLNLHGQSKHFESLFKHFYSSLLCPTLPQKFFDHEIEIIGRNLENQKEEPTKILFKKVFKHFFKGHSYHYPIQGSQKSIKNISLSELVKTKDEIVNKRPLTLCYCGDADFDTIYSMIHEQFKNLPTRKDTSIKIFHPKNFSPVDEHIKLEREQTHIFWGTLAFATGDKRDLYLKIITSLLSGQSSDLFVLVRDQLGLCYSVQPIHFTALEGGYWGIYMASGYDKKDQAIKAISEILERIKKEGISKTELSRAKKIIIGQTQLSLQTNDDYSSTYSIPVLHKLGLDWHHKEIERIQKIEKNELDSFISDFFNQKFSLLTVGKE